MKKCLLFPVIAVLLAVAAKAQPTPIAVTPGAKGQLPEVPTLSGLADGRFAALELVYAEASNSAYGIVTNQWHYHAWLSFPTPTEMFEDAEYYTIESRYSGDFSWITITGSDNKPAQFTGNTADLVIGDDVDFRLVVHGGEHDGYISNEVSVTCPTMRTIWRATSRAIGNIFQLIDQPEGDISVHVQTYKNDGNTVDILNEQGYFRYQWYRRNPATYELTLIEGANDSIYTPTLEDVGYELVAQINGDEEHCSFTMCCYWERNVVQVPIQTYVTYYGDDGFVLNTDYEISNPKEDITVVEAMGYEDNDKVALNVVERQPGVYAIHEPKNVWANAMLEHKNAGYKFVVHYNVQWQEDEEPHLWIREHQLMADRYRVPLNVKTEFAGRTVPTTIDIIGPNIDGELVVKQSATIEDGQTDGVTFEEGLYSIGNGYYVKARETGSTLATYYPSALLWMDASLFIPSYDEDYNTPSITIEPRAIPSPLTGMGTIEGTISHQAAEAKAKGYRTVTSEDAETEAYTVYLQQKNGEIIASAVTDQDGNYKFENVPFGTYSVLVNVDGCTQEEPIEVTLTEAQPTAGSVDYSINSDGIIVASTTGIHSVKANAAVRTYYTIDGRALQGVPAQRGIYIVNGKKVVIK